jgi:hypothetical protein
VRSLTLAMSEIIGAFILVGLVGAHTFMWLRCRG